MNASRWITGPLALFDLVLGIGAVAMPGLYLSLMHGSAESGVLVQRTGMIWLFFCACETTAFFGSVRWPLSVFVVGILRLMDVPADAVYGIVSPSLTALGRISLVAAPLFNAVAGVVLIRLYSSSSKSGT